MSRRSPSDKHNQTEAVVRKSGQPPRRVPRQDAEGLVEEVNAGVVSGWLWDRKVPDEALSVEVIGPDGFYARAPANQHRSDLQVAGKRGGHCWFRLPLPAYCAGIPLQSFVVLLDGTGHKVKEVGASDHSLILNWIDSQDAAFQTRLLVLRLCYDILGREPTAAELAEWQQHVLREPLELSLLVRKISETKVQRCWTVEELVQNAYRGVLNRDAEARGIELYGAALRNGLPLSDLISELIRTPEFRSKAALAPAVGDGGTGELRRLAAAIECAMLTLAIGAAGQGNAEWVAATAGPVIVTDPAVGGSEAASVSKRAVRA